MNTTQAIAVHGGYAQRILTAAGSMLEAGLAAWRTRREQRSAVAHLRSMSDAELRDIGVERESIEPAVTYGRHYDHRPIGII